MYENAKINFEKFLKENYDRTNDKIAHKIKHTYYVVENAKYICEDRNLSLEDTELAMIIALLHDIGRFDQAKKMETFREDITSYDHATLGVKLLFELGEIRNFIEDRQYDEIIKKAIANHSKYILEEKDFTPRELLHCKIIRDADKLDSFRAKATDDIFTMSNITEQNIEESFLTDKVYDDFLSEKTIFSKDRKTGIDMWVSYIAFLFGLEFDSSLKRIKEKNYINILFDRFEYKKEQEKMEILRRKALDYIDNKIEGGIIMEEMVDVLDENTGEITGKVISKKEAHKTGAWHSSIHILIVNKDHTKTLLQKRCETKDLYPNTWDIAVGGHISAGENAINSAKRELEEELGLDSSKYDFEIYDIHKEMFQNNGVTSNEFVSIFVLYDDIDIHDISLQVEEVSEAKWCTKEELNEFIKTGNILSHDREYEILNEILK